MGNPNPRQCLGLAIAWASLLLGACGKQPAVPAAGQPGEAPLVAKFDTPEASFQALTSLKGSEDPSALLHCLSEAHVNYLAGNLAFRLQRTAAFSDGGLASAACLKVLKSHGLDQVDIMEFLQIVDSPVPGGATPGFMQIGDSIKDKPAFFREAGAAMKLVDEKSQPDVESGVKTKAAEADEKPPTAKLVDVQVKGDRAEGTTVIGDDDSTKTQLFFRRENNSWVIAVAAEEPDWRKPIQGRFLFSDLLK